MGRVTRDWFPKRKSDYRPPLWTVFFICLSVFLLAEIMQKQPPTPVLYPYTIQLPGSADGN